MVGTIRFIALILIALSYFLMRLRKKNERSEDSQKDELQNFQKTKRDSILGKLIRTTRQIGFQQMRNAM